jgi:hypothetical protein
MDAARRAATFPSRARGLGGGGALFRPVVSPHNPAVSFVACDMGGLYRTADDGATWQMLDGRKVRGSTRFAAAFDPATADHVVAAHPILGLQESADRTSEDHRHMRA